MVPLFGTGKTSQTAMSGGTLWQLPNISGLGGDMDWFRRQTKPKDREQELAELEEQVKELEKQVELRQRETKLKARLKELKQEKAKASPPLPVGKLVIWMGVGLFALFIIGKIAGC